MLRSAMLAIILTLIVLQADSCNEPAPQSDSADMAMVIIDEPQLVAQERATPQEEPATQQEEPGLGSLEPGMGPVMTLPAEQLRVSQILMLNCGDVSASICGDESVSSQQVFNSGEEICVFWQEEGFVSNEELEKMKMDISVLMDDEILGDRTIVGLAGERQCFSASIHPSSEIQGELTTRLEYSMFFADVSWTIAEEEYY